MRPALRRLTALPLVLAIAGCGTVTRFGPSAPAASSLSPPPLTVPASPSPPPSPVSTQCEVGYSVVFAPNGVQYGSDNDGAIPDAPFYPGQPPQDDPNVAMPAIKITYTNNGSAPVTITKTTAVVYLNGVEQESVSGLVTNPQVLTAGQSTYGYVVGPSYAGGDYQAGDWSSDAQNMLAANMPGPFNSCLVVGPVTG